MQVTQANLENCGPPPGNNFDLEVGQGQDKGHGMVPYERACPKIMHAKYKSLNALSLILQKI